MKKLKKMSLVNIQDSLSKEEMKQIMAGSDGTTRCGYNISCEGHSEFQSCGTSGRCGCTYVAGGGYVLYCRQDG